jgi:hypothetical protein
LDVEVDEVFELFEKFSFPPFCWVLGLLTGLDEAVDELEVVEEEPTVVKPSRDFRCD